MRREWSGWIKARQWGEFEKLAKLDPSQGLADTIAELELGFPEKADRRALRKVLYLLAQSGYEPRELEELASEFNTTIAPFEVAFMVSPDGLGESVITYAKEERGRVSWLVAHVNFRTGVTRAVEDTTTVDEAQTKLIRFQNMTPSPYVSAEVPIPFALERLAVAVDQSRTLPPVMAYWRGILPKEISENHPADSLSRSPRTDEEFGELFRVNEAMLGWRLELGSLAPLMLELHQTKDTEDPGGRESTWHRIVGEYRRQLFTPETLTDHHRRLLDLAYLTHLKRLPNADIVLALADDLQQLGAESKYARHVTDKSLLLYIRTLQTRNEEDRAAVSQD